VDNSDQKRPENEDQKRPENEANSGELVKPEFRSEPETASEAIEPERQSPILPEVLPATRNRVDVNIFLFQVAQRVDPSEMVATTRQMFELINEFEHKDVELFKARADALIDAKTRDPDEVDKRKSNAVRRVLKIVVAVLAAVMLFGGIGIAAYQGSIVVAALLISSGAVGLAMIVFLATGESLTASDLVRVITAAARSSHPLPQPPPDPEQKGKQQ
jgi:hypothetical protein